MSQSAVVSLHSAGYCLHEGWEDEQRFFELGLPSHTWRVSEWKTSQPLVLFTVLCL